MRLVSYHPNNPEVSLRELGNLCYKLLKTRRVVLIYVKSMEVAHKISDAFWKSHYFIPHGIEGEEFDMLQPIIIATNLYERDIIIQPEEVLVKDSELTSKHHSFILWDCMPYSRDFDRYQQDHNGRWFKIASGQRH